MNPFPYAVPAEEYLTLPRSPETWLIEPLLPTGGSALLYGDPKVGKSFAALQLAGCLTRGASWLGFRTRPSKVLYIQLDTPRSLWALRLELLRSSSKGASRPYPYPPALEASQALLELPPTNTSSPAPISPISPPPWAGVILADRETLSTWPFNILQEDHSALLRLVCDHYNPDCVILDTIREAHQGDENDSTVMQSVIALLTAAVKPAALVVIAHSRKANYEHGPDLMSDNRGSNYLVGKMDAIIRFSYTSMRVSGRSLDEQSIPIERLDNGFWDLAKDPAESLAMDLLATNKPIRELARVLHETSGKSEVAARAYLRRLQAKKEQK